MMTLPTTRALFVPLALLMLAGCATAVPPVSVTRFHTAEPTALAPGMHYRIDAAPLANTDPSVGTGSSSLEWESYRTAVDRELQRLGFVRSDPAEQAVPLLVRVGFERRASESDGGGRSPVSVGVGGSTGGYGSGVGVGIGFSLGGGPRKTTDLRMLVRIDAAGSGNALWEGRAETVVPQKSPAAQPSLAAAKLAGALFRDFPGESGRTISVP